MHRGIPARTSSRNGEDIYLVENKIYDQNHHFDQYISTFGIPAERLGYISNYPMVEAGCTVHTWDEFYHHLQHLQQQKTLKNANSGGPIWSMSKMYVQFAKGQRKWI